MRPWIAIAMPTGIAYHKVFGIKELWLGWRWQEGGRSCQKGPARLLHLPFWQGWRALSTESHGRHGRPLPNGEIAPGLGEPGGVSLRVRQPLSRSVCLNRGLTPPGSPCRHQTGVSTMVRTRYSVLRTQYLPRHRPSPTEVNGSARRLHDAMAHHLAAHPACARGGRRPRRVPSR